jgi:hypothetical protein
MKLGSRCMACNKVVHNPRDAQIDHVTIDGISYLRMCACRKCNSTMKDQDLGNTKVAQQQRQWFQDTEPEQVSSSHIVSWLQHDPDYPFDHSMTMEE